MKRLDLKGKTFGNWLVLDFYDVKNSKSRWTCKCGLCSNNYVLYGTMLTSNKFNNGKCKSCAGKIRPYEFVYNNLVRVSQKRGIKVELSYEEYINEFVKKYKNCHYCDAEITWIEHIKIYKKGLKRPSKHNLDRKDNTLGYSVNNCVPCCYGCNFGKSNYFTYNEWVVMATALKEYRQKLTGNDNETK